MRVLDRDTNGVISAALQPNRGIEAATDHACLIAAYLAPTRPFVVLGARAYRKRFGLDGATTERVVAEAATGTSDAAKLTTDVPIEIR